jgi:DNA-binding CsgD family transcriptional regulator
VDVSAYRIMQEALSNALKHGRAGPGPFIHRSRDELEIAVTDDGGGTGTGEGSGHGLVGMRERVSVYLRPRRRRLRRAARPRQRLPAQGRTRRAAAHGDPHRRDGGLLFAPSVTRRLIQRLGEREAPTAPPGALADLTYREHEVLRLIARGLSNTEIAAQLIVSEHTAKSHVSRILRKLDLCDRVQAVVPSPTSQA